MGGLHQLTVVNSFAKEVQTKVRITTFNTMNEAVSKLLRSGLSYDLLIGADGRA